MLQFQWKTLQSIRKRLLLLASLLVAAEAIELVHLIQLSRFVRFAEDQRNINPSQSREPLWLVNQLMVFQ